jgi:hypothetical protein
MAARISSIFSGISGQYFVAAELSRREYVATVTLRNTCGIDILAASADSSRSVGIQVKTNQGRRKHWLLNRKCETLHEAGMFYIFVNLNGLNMPAFHIVPAAIVAKTIAEGHEKWLATPGRGGKARNNNPMRAFSDVEGLYLDKWESLGLG